MREIPRQVSAPTFDDYAKSLQQWQVDRMLLIEHNYTGSMGGLLMKLKDRGYIDERYQLSREPGQDDEERK
jgi:hypothetical protein